MLYSHLDIWKDAQGQIWRSLYRPGTRDMSLGPYRERDVPKLIAWAQSHRLTINDKRDQ